MKNRQAGRPPKIDPANHFYAFKLNSEEKLRFDAMLEKSGLADRSKYIKSVLFGREIKVVKIDKATTDYYIRLTEILHQFRAVGNNYNQTVKAVKTNYGEKRGLQLLYRLEKTAIELVVLSRKVIELTKEYEQKWLQK